MGAAPDGGMVRNEVTAYIESVTEMDSADFVNGAVLDFVLHPSAVQGNVMNLEMLLDAQKPPENYRTLQVRVCGWNEYFVELSKDMQNKFIAQLQGS